MNWTTECPDDQTVLVELGFYHLTLCTRKTDSGIWGDYQTIYVYMNQLAEMPQMAWNGVPYLCKDGKYIIDRYF